MSFRKLAPLTLAVAVAASLPACSKTEAAAGDKPAFDLSQVKTPLISLDVADLDPSANACTDLNAFVNGKWLAANPVPPQTCYQYFKEALIVWSMTEAQPWFMAHSVRMNSVAPGPVFTPILGDFVSMLGEERVARDSQRMLRPALADEVAAVIAFLCSDASRWINGANLPVDGGLAASYV